MIWFVAGFASCFCVMCYFEARIQKGKGLTPEVSVRPYAAWLREHHFYTPWPETDTDPPGPNPRSGGPNPCSPGPNPRSGDSGQRKEARSRARGPATDAYEPPISEGDVILGKWLDSPAP